MFTSDNNLRLGLVFIAALDATLYILSTLFIFWRILYIIRSRSLADDCKTPLPATRAIGRINYYFNFSITLTFLLAIVCVFAYLLAAATDIDGFSSWRVDYNSGFLIFHFLFLLIASTIVGRKMWFPSDVEFVAKVTGYFNIMSFLYFPQSSTRAFCQEAVLPNDLLSLVMQPISIVLIVFVFWWSSSGVMTDPDEKKVVGDAV